MQTAAAVLGNGEAPGDMIPAEFKNNLFTKKVHWQWQEQIILKKQAAIASFILLQGKQLMTTNAKPN